MKSVRPGLVVLAMCALLTLAGCGKEDKETPKGPASTGNRARMPPPGNGTAEGSTPAPVPAEFVAARKTFDRTCAKCHSLVAGAAGAGDKGAWNPPPFKPPQDKGFGGGFKGMMPKGPNLANVGADPLHTRDWIVGYIRDPRSQNPKSRMPQFEGKLSAEDIGALAHYLSSLK